MKKVVGIWVIGAAVCSGCGGSLADISGTGIISFDVTDAPVDTAEAVVITISRVELTKAGGAAGPSFVLSPPRTVDLLQLHGTNSAALLEPAVVPEGEYEKVRLTVDSANANCKNLSPPFASYITIDGTDYPLVVPSDLKVGPIVVAGTVAYTIDFDLRKSIAQRGATGCYNLRPTLRLVNNAEVGSLAGSVDGDLLNQAQCTADPITGEGAAVYVYSGSGVAPDDLGGTGAQPVTTAFITSKSDGSGDFDYEVGFLEPGDYTVALTCQAKDDDPERNDQLGFESSLNASVTTGQQTRRDFSLLATNR